MKKTLSTILLGASLICGTANQSNGQECQTYNHDNDEFKEEIICWKDEGFIDIKQNYRRSEMGATIIYCMDKNNDNFHEFIRVSNFKNMRGSYGKFIVIEDFNIDKKTGLIDYSIKKEGIDKFKWNKYFANKNFIELAKVEFPSSKYMVSGYHPYLTEQDLYNMGLGSRIKKIMNTCESGNLDEMKRVVEVEKNYFKTNRLKTE